MDTVQRHHRTAFLRNDSILTACVSRFSSTRPNQPLKVLSFGCSVGDEITTLRLFLSEATVFACDIVPEVVAISKARFAGDPSVHVFVSDWHEIAAHGPYDLIMASAVLCLNPSPANYSEVFPFAKFEEIIERFDQNLSPNGLLVIPNAAYRLADCSVAPRYRPVRSDTVTSNGFVDVFYRDGSPCLRQVASFGNPIYSRHGNYKDLEDESLADCIFEKSVGSSDDGAIPFLRLNPLPAGLEPFSTIIKRNTDYLAAASTLDILTVETRVSLWRDHEGATAGFSLLVGWTSFGADTMYFREEPVWYGIGNANWTKLP